jgi:hypothetical protein
MFTISDILNIIGFDVLTPVVMNKSIFWDITSCRALKFIFQRSTWLYISEDRNIFLQYHSKPIRLITNNDGKDRCVYDKLQIRTSDISFSLYMNIQTKEKVYNRMDKIALEAS